MILEAVVFLLLGTMFFGTALGNAAGVRAQPKAALGVEGKK